MTVLVLAEIPLRLLKNRVLLRIRRLKQARYLIGTLAAIGYFALVLRPWDRAPVPRHVLAQGTADPEVVVAIETGLAAALTIFAMLVWLWPSRGAALQFSEAEIAFLFPAPLTRRQVIDYALLKSQVGILFGVGILSLFALRRLTGSGWRAFLGAWLVFTCMHLYTMAIGIVRGNIARHGVGGWKRAWPVGVVFAAVAAGIAVAWARGSLRPPDPVTGASLAAWARGLAGTPPTSWILLPARSLIHPVFTDGVTAFGIAAVPCLGVLAAAYLWIVRSDFRYEEASAELASRRAERAAVRARGGRRFERSGVRGRRSPIPLGPTGGATGAILWKNFTATWRITIVPWLLGGAAAVAAASLILSGTLRAPLHTTVATAIGIQSLAFAGILILLGPEMVRTDLRTDLLRADVLKSWPVGGPELMLGEVAQPALVISALQALLVVAGIPLLGELAGAVPERVWIGAAAGLLLAVPLNLAMALLNNAALLLLPAWHHLGPSKARGFDAIGQVLVGALLRLLSLAVALLPAAVVMGGVVFLLWGALDAVSLLVGAVAAAVPLLIECWLGVRAVGYLFERFDPSKDLDALG